MHDLRELYYHYSFSEKVCAYKKGVLNNLSLR